MKKILLLLICITGLSANSFDLVGKVVPEPTTGYLMFNDGTFWKVNSFVTRWRGPLEWLSGEELYVPDDYNCEVSEWSYGDPYEVYYKLGNLRVDESHASNQEILQKHTYLMTNLRTGKTFFATQIQPTEFLELVLIHGKNSGYNKGYSEGYDKGYSDGKRSALAPQAR